MKARLKRVMKIFAAAAGMSLLMVNVAAADYVNVETQEAFENCFTFKMDEKEYQLPCLLSDLLEDGWEINVTDDSLKAGYSGLLSLKREDSRLSVGVMNLTDETLMLEECQVYLVRIYAEDAEEEEGGFELAYADGISLGMTFEEVMEKLGASYAEGDAVTEVMLNDTAIPLEIGEYGGNCLSYGVKIGEEDPQFESIGYNQIWLEFDSEGLLMVDLEYWADLMETEVETEIETGGEKDE